MVQGETIAVPPSLPDHGSLVSWDNKSVCGRMHEATIVTLTVR